MQQEIQPGNENARADGTQADGARAESAWIDGASHTNGGSISPEVAERKPIINDIGDVLDRGGRVDDIERIFERTEPYTPIANLSDVSLSERNLEPDMILDHGADVVMESATPALLRIVPNHVQGMNAQKPVRQRSGDRIRIVKASDVKPEKVTWLWQDRLPRGKISLIDGDPGLGKSTVLLDLAARISNGAAMPDGARLDRPGSVLILSAEDGVADTMVPRLYAARADLDRIVIATSVEQADCRTRPVVLPDDFERLREMILDYEVGLMIIDPLMAFLSGRVDSHKDQDVRAVLHQMKEIAEKTNAAMILCRHLTKSGGANPLYRGGGSIAILAAARVAWLVGPDPDTDGMCESDPEGTSPRRIIATSKSNVGKTPKALAYRVGIDREWDCSRAIWEGTTDHRASDLAAAVPADSSERGALGEAKQFLLEALRNGAQLSKDIEAEAHAYGIETRTLRRARERLGVKAMKEKKAKGQWLWVLPGTEGIERDQGPFEVDHVGQVRRPKFGEKGEDDHDNSKLTTFTGVVKFEDQGPATSIPFEVDQDGQVGQARRPKFGEKGEDGHENSKLATHTQMVNFENQAPAASIPTDPDGWESGII
jgi:AAA domain